MDETKDFLRKIVQLLNDPGNELLEKEISSYRKAFPENEKLFREIDNLWNISSELKDLELINTDEAVKRLSARLGINAARSANESFVWIRNIAAVLLLGILGYWFWHTTTQVDYITRSTGSLIDSVKLQDGTTIYLSENTSLKYPEELKGDIRQVYLLRGEAFFNVAEDARRPFIVAVDSSKVTVLGTSFNIRSAGRQTELAVRTGKVKFEAPNGKETSILTAGDGLIYYHSTGKTDHFTDRSGSDFAWLTHELTFVDASLSDVLSSLEKYYKVKFRVEGPLSAYSKFNASFKNNRLDEVLAILKETYPIQIGRRDSLIMIKSK